MRFFKKSMEKTIKDTVSSEVMLNRLNGLVAEFSASIVEASAIENLRKDLVALQIDKSRREEEYARIERELIHKIGLEKHRQEVELEQAKKEATLTVREEQLKADRARFEAQMEFQNKRFTEEIGYLKEMVGQLVAKSPNASLIFSKEESSRG